ncbi:hypothetical protein GUJ93_ZPchr0010g7258 [Zizania palustris]|uniref:Uncharacterized protein n=1 Tax=Zizania palustris TaxID=103762 RepID=A0A8J5W9Z4_ZIZPA|nr:hypothetical protein GUJ93_ZPchr0010g7258 [Zizania palustris]
MASLKLGHVCLTVVLFSVGISSCRGQGGGGGGAAAPGTQDAIQIVAQAALCFDNRTVINGCLQAMGFNVSGSGGGSGSKNASAGAAAAGANGSTAALCSPPCFAQMSLMMECVNDALGNIQGYNPGLMQGVLAIYDMACAHGGAAAGSPSPNSGSDVEGSSPGQPASSVAGPTASLTGVFSTVLMVCAGTGLMLF